MTSKQNKKAEDVKITSENSMKVWDKDEENQLIEEINSLLDISKIADSHKRTVGGIKARLKKIIDTKNSDKIKNISNVIKKYFTSEFDKKDINSTISNSIHSKLLGYETIEEIVDEFKIEELELKGILFKLLNKEKNTLYKSKINKLINSSIIDIILNCHTINDIILKNDYLKTEDAYLILNNILKGEVLDIIKRERIKVIIKKYEEIIDDMDDKDNKNNRNNYKDNKDKYKQEQINIDNNEIYELLKEIQKDMRDIKSDINMIKQDIIKLNKTKKNKTSKIDIIDTCSLSEIST
jgi:hypothetical protein